MSSVFDSIFSAVDAFVYRCRNDSDYTMDFLAGGVRRSIGYDEADILGNAKVSYVGLTHPDDKDRVFADVDLAIEKGESWDLSYRLQHKMGHYVWVRECGCAVFEDGELAYLQGLVRSAEAELKLRDKLEDSMKSTQAVCDDIVQLTSQITKSVRELSMLSINARIEAARSGEAGKGFAVVANEIKNLADHNAEWADKIAERVSLINGAP